jgi:hypothetical protein
VTRAPPTAVGRGGKPIGQRWDSGVDARPRSMKPGHPCSCFVAFKFCQIAVALRTGADLSQIFTKFCALFSHEKFDTATIP